MSIEIGKEARQLFPVTVKTDEKGRVRFEVNGQPLRVVTAEMEAIEYENPYPVMTIRVPVRFGDVRS